MFLLSTGYAFSPKTPGEELETWVFGRPTSAEPLAVAGRPYRDPSQGTVLPEPLARERGLSDELGGGRKALAEEASHRIRTILQICPEDFGALAKRLPTTI